MMSSQFFISLVALTASLTAFLCFGSVELNPAPLPIFLRSGFSSVLEFEDTPTRVVLGDAQSFQVERLDRSLVLRTLAPYATTNMFVYFDDEAPRLFVLTASEDAEPTYFKRIELPKPIKPPLALPNQGAQPGSRASIATREQTPPQVSAVLTATFDDKKDYLTLEARISADSKGLTRPNWDLIRLRHLSSVQAPFKLWAERKEIQKDSSIRIRLIFAKPNIPRDLTNALLIVPIEGQVEALSLPLVRGVR